MLNEVAMNKLYATASEIYLRLGPSGKASFHRGATAIDHDGLIQHCGCRGRGGATRGWVGIVVGAHVVCCSCCAFVRMGMKARSQAAVVNTV